MSTLSVTVYDTAYTHSPTACAVSRVVLHLWHTDFHPKTPGHVHRVPPLASSLVDALTRITFEAPEFCHGALIHGVQKHPKGPVEPPVISTMTQYIGRYTALGFVALRPATRRRSEPVQHIVVHRMQEKSDVPRWLWSALGASLLHDVEIVGDPPPSLG